MITIAATIKETNIAVTEKIQKAITELLWPMGKKELNLSSGRETDGNVGISASEVGCACSLSGLPNPIASCGLLRLMTTWNLRWCSIQSRTVWKIWWFMETPYCNLSRIQNKVNEHIKSNGVWAKQAVHSMQVVWAKEQVDEQMTQFLMRLF